MSKERVGETGPDLKKNGLLKFIPLMGLIYVFSKLAFNAVNTPQDKAVSDEPQPVIIQHNPDTGETTMTISDGAGNVKIIDDPNAEVPGWVATSVKAWADHYRGNDQGDKPSSGVG